MTSTPSSSTSRAIYYFTERAEDAQAALLGVLGGGGSGPGGAQGPSGADRYLAQVDVGAVGDQGLRATRNKLESSTEHERIEGLRTFVAMISKSLPAADHLFPSVLKLTSVQSMQVKTLVYLVTLRLAPSQPDVALLSINSFQRDLADSSPLIRGMALRVLSSLGVKMAASIIEMAIARSVRDASFYVRRIAADAIAKCSELAPSLLPSLVPHLSTLLADKHPSVLGSALLAFTCTVPQRYDLLHPHFRRICHALVDIDEWNQPAALRLLASYARLDLPRPSNEAANAVEDPRSEKKVPGRTRWGTGLDPDLELLLNKTQPLLSSRNSASVLSAAHLYLALLPSSHPSHAQLVQPLLRLTRCQPTQALVALHFVRALISLRPDLFSQRDPSITSAFLPLSTLAGEPVYVSKAKLDVLVDLALASKDGESGPAVALALDELEEAALHRPEAALKAHATRGLGRLATSSRSSSSSSSSDNRLTERCTQVLLSILKTSPTSSGSKTKRSGGSSGGNEADNRAVQRAVEVLRAIVHVKASAHKPDGSASTAAGLLVYTLSQLLFKADTDAAATKSTASGSSSSSSSSSVKLTSRSSLHDPQARATLFWIMGQYCQLEVPVAARSPSSTTGQRTMPLFTTVLPDVLRKAALNFSNEGREAKLAILGFAAKIGTILSGSGAADGSASQELATSVRRIYAYSLELARYDVSVDVRDRARFLRGLTAGLESGQPGKGEEKARDNDGDGEEAQTSGGVRLRREQVMKVLFNERPGGPAAGSSQAGAKEDDTVRGEEVDAALLLDPARLALLPAGRSPLSMAPRRNDHGEGVGLPPWTTDASLLPPASVRDHVVPAAEPVTSAAALLCETNTNASAGGWASPQGRASPAAAGGSSTPVGGAAGRTVAAPQGKGKYKDLDAFLDESSEEESSSSEEEESGEEEESEEEEEEQSSDEDEEEDQEESEEEDESEDEAEGEGEGGKFLGHDGDEDDARRSTNAWAD